ncbi:MULTISPECIES: cysteine desulfurase family protein [unclassified Lactococcus]|uniref:cysteine desulfurase family protein n=1 Tax=unclassified Lactococcus TaxID=2643510 RepID=UPI0011C74C52|nr:MULTISPECIES: cysteine desulfurase family protein [unclassified Lactococcus]MQW23739.1 aminotransferase class V-fold PLP-dependent enzyme [Lactococcus sp. dk101]TXK37466.1 cysteine desulfurase [Lactococcus sp. dk310]TXK48809.1 cysteine desulfurase [Lactococcus sp. dk322]
MIYLDNAATTPVLPEVVEVMSDTLLTTFGNPSSIHSYGRVAFQTVRQSREVIAQALQVSARQITFTSGASESNNTAIIGYALAHRKLGNHIVTTAIEHPSVINTVQYLHDRHGFDITFVQPEPDGSVSADSIKNALRPDTILVSMMWSNNETGQLLPVSEVGEILSHHQAVFHVDATQVMGKIPVHPLEIKADFVSASGHKFHGPKGVGFLYHVDLLFDPLIHGGEQEEKRRAGTENLHSLVGMAKALQISVTHMSENYEKVEQLKTHLFEQISDLTFYKNEFGKSMPHVVNLAFPERNHDLLLTKLDLAGIAISTGSACTAGTIEPSHVLASIYGESSPKLKENIRISFSELNTIDEIDEFAIKLKNALK